MKTDIIKCRDIIVYGAGVIASSVIKRMKYLGYSLKGIAVTDTVSQPKYVNGLVVKKAEEWRKKRDDYFVLVAVNAGKQTEIFDYCQSIGFEDIGFVDHEFDDELSVEAYTRILAEHNIDITNDYLDSGSLRIINPLKSNEINIRNSINAIGNIILPEYLCEYSIGQESPYEHGLVQLRKDDVLFDLGANVGVYSAVGINKGAKVFSFEPDCSLHKYIKENTSINGEESVIVPLAVSDCCGKTDFYINTDSRAANSLFVRDSHIEKVSVNTITIDSFVKENDINRIDFIKADIEGAERHMLEGARETIRKFSPKLSLCTYHLSDDVKVLTEMIMDINFNYKIVYGWKKLFAYCD